MANNNVYMLKELKFISAQPAIPYYAWQVETYLTNFEDVGYSLSDVQVVCSFEDSIDQQWLDLQMQFPEAKFFFYKDTMEYRKYAPAIQSMLMAKHFERFPELKEFAVFFHDCDFIFTKYLDFTPFLQDDIWYFSDTRSYMGAAYIESKGHHKTEKTELGAPISLLDGMAKNYGMCPCVARANQEKTGGAQKLMKNLTADYWWKVHNKTIDLYSWLLREKDNYGEKAVNDIQVWTASMWGELWTAWTSGHKVEIPKEFDFCWATDPIERWNQVYFFHNAGVTHDRKELFYKSNFMTNLPYDSELEVDSTKCSSRYYELIKSVETVL